MGLSRLVAAGPPDPEHALKLFKAKACAGLKCYQNIAFFEGTKGISRVYLIIVTAARFTHPTLLQVIY